MDLTVVYLTASEIPEKFARKQQHILQQAAKNYPIVSVSRKPLQFGELNILDTSPKSLSNIYLQMLRAAKLTTTPYIAIAEDDCYYPKEHFLLRPAKTNEVIYNQNRFALFTWGVPTYSWRNRKSNCSLVAPREYLVEALEERFAKWPQGTPDNITGEIGRGMVERNLGISLRNSSEVFGEVSIIQFNHDYASEPRQKSHRKRLGPIKAYDIPYWGPAKTLVEDFV